MLNVEEFAGHSSWTLENFREPVWQFSIIQLQYSRAWRLGMGPPRQMATSCAQ